MHKSTLNLTSAFMLRKRLVELRKKFKKYQFEKCVGEPQYIEALQKRLGNFDDLLKLYDVAGEAIVKLSHEIEEHNAVSRGILAELNMLNDTIEMNKSVIESLERPMYEMTRNPVTGVMEKVEYARVTDVNFSERDSRLKQRKIKLEDLLSSTNTSTTFEFELPDELWKELYG